MLDLTRQCVEIGIGVGGEGEYVADAGIEHRVKLREIHDACEVVPSAALVAHGHYPIFGQGVLHLHRVEVDIGDGHVNGVRIDVGRRIRTGNNGKTIWSEAGGELGIQRITERVVAGAEGEGDLAVNERSAESAYLSAAADAVAGHERGVALGVVKGIVIKAVISDTKAASDDKFVVVQVGAPGETEARTEVAPGLIPLLAGIDFGTEQQAIGWIVGGHEVCEIPFCLSWWSVIFPTHTEVDGKVGAEFPVVLKEQTVDGRSVISALSSRRAAGDRVHVNAFVDGRSVGPIPQALEDLDGTSASDQAVVILLVAVFEAKL